MSKKRFSMVAYTGLEVFHPLFDRLVIDVAGIRNPETMPALREHQRDRSVGVIDGTEKETSTYSAEGYFVGTADGVECQDLIGSGYPMQASIGCWFDEIELIEQNEIARVIWWDVFRSWGYRSQVVCEGDLLLQPGRRPQNQRGG